MQPIILQLSDITNPPFLFVAQQIDALLPIGFPAFRIEMYTPLTTGYLKANQQILQSHTSFFLIPLESSKHQPVQDQFTLLF
ncbi:MAG: hypothetical protein WC760_04815 [Bacteroidia bacterium]